MSRGTGRSREPAVWGGEISQGRWKQGRGGQGCGQNARRDLSLAFAPVYPTGNGLSNFFSEEGHRGLYGRNRVLGC